MSIFASRVTDTIPIPFDPPHTVTIQKLAGRHLAKAKQAWFNELVKGISDRGGSRVQKDLEELFKKVEQDPGGQDATAIKKVQADPLSGYDPHTLVAHGVKGWTYTDRPITPESIEDLADEAIDFFARAVLKLTKPELFQTEAEAEAERKNA